MSQDEGKGELLPIFVSLIPNLMGGEGHILPYHQAVSQAVKQLGWTHFVAVPYNSKVDDLPLGWHEALSNYDLEKEGSLGDKFLSIQGTWELGKSMADYLNSQIIPQSRSSIIFFERFIHLQLLALLIALFLVKNDNLSVWLLYRRDTHKDQTRWIYKLLNSLVKWRLKSNKFQLLTDSELLSQSLTNYFQESVKVMPIPHTDIISYNTNLSDNATILCWWPGSPREEKGWTIINQLISYSGEESQNISLVCAESSQLKSVKNGVDLKLIKTHLTRDEYHYWFGLSKVILLPYNSPAYQARTSGIFTECIMAGKIPLVTAQTWMAYELLKYNLAELVIDWQEAKAVFELIKTIVKNDIIRDKIQAMQRSYEQFHCVDNYANIMDKLFQETVD
ncbi:glycosyltransferase family 1 protein [Crocosphaera sp. XPORK-15E]|uniref:glycosyltransferase family 1 protein n=1 Tax=Crocosphaera sp. XPORK-15E TaxID=3110247 RepID=UPI002B1FC28B|nr:glycosyltransferase family 1 protein [Crocosphaera sp. XPORK-15E]MEA5535460.1 glycosyltransferase family 1 protein [Crocosphaera sp. XPORK-15E]